MGRAQPIQIPSGSKPGHGHSCFAHYLTESEGIRARKQYRLNLNEDTTNEED